MKLPLVVLIVIISMTLWGHITQASCGQSPDTFILYKNGKRIYDSNVLVLNTNQIYSPRKFSSICINGICRTGQSSEGIYLVTVTDKKFIETTNKMIDDYIASSTEWNKRFPGDLHYSADQHIVFQLPNLPELLLIAEQAPREPFPPVEDIANNFTYEHCGYSRIIYYDVAEKKFLRHYEKGQIDEDREYEDLFKGTKFETNNRFKESQEYPASLLRNSSVRLFAIAILLIIVGVFFLIWKRKIN